MTPDATRAAHPLGVAIDFDGVIHSYVQGWTGGVPQDPPVPGALEFVQMLVARGYEVTVHTTRASTTEGHIATIEWLARYGFPRLLVTNQKPKAILYIDDRALRFRGSFNEARAEKAEAERDRYKREADDYEEREAACCPEDVGFDEFIAALKKRAEKAEAALVDARLRADNAEALISSLGKAGFDSEQARDIILDERERAVRDIKAMKARTFKAEAALAEIARRAADGSLSCPLATSIVTQAHEEAGARVDLKTQEPPSGASIPNQGTAPNASPAGGSATLTWADLRPWLAFVEAMAVDVARPSNGSAKRWRDAARALSAGGKHDA